MFFFFVLTAFRDAVQLRMQCCWKEHNKHQSFNFGDEFFHNDFLTMYLIFNFLLKLIETI